MTTHYLDNSASTPVCRSAADKAYEAMTQFFGNPSSLHSMGIEAERELESAREAIAESLSADPKEIIFTSGGTESNNLAVLSAAEAKKRIGKKIVTTAIEHSSVLDSAKQLEKEGFEVIFLKPESDGSISAEALEQAIDKDTILVSIMAINNETGARQPIEDVSKIIKSKNSRALFHIDAVQAYGKLPLCPKKIGADLMTVSSHKVYGPKGAGALYIRRGLALPPRAFGGEQEGKIRPGTQPLPAIAGFAAAVREFDAQGNLSQIKQLHDYTLERLKQTDGIVINSPGNALEYIINISAEGIRSETMMHFLAQRGVYVSSSSACARGKKSYVLKAMGLSEERIDSALRISFSKYNTLSDADALIEGLRLGLDSLVRRNK